jgi:hypothetical protein
MDPLNLRVLTLADNISGDRLVQTIAASTRPQDHFPRSRASTSKMSVRAGRTSDSTAARRYQAGALGVGEAASSLDYGSPPMAHDC